MIERLNQLLNTYSIAQPIFLSLNDLIIQS